MNPAAELIVAGRIATLAGPSGLGWVEAVAITAGRIVAAGSLSDVNLLAGPSSRRLDLAPDEIVVPGITDAHLHLVEAALSAERVDLEPARTLAEGLERIRTAHRSLKDPTTWLEGGGWDVDRWGGWPTAVDLDRVAPGRRVAVWAHDRHALWASAAALADAGIDSGSEAPDGGAIRRTDDGTPSGVLHETATRLVMAKVPFPTRERLERTLAIVSRELAALGIVAAHDPGWLAPDPNLATWPAYGDLADRGELAVRVAVAIRSDALATAIERGWRSGAAIGQDRDGRARVGWQKIFGDGSLGSRTAALLEPYEAPAAADLEPANRSGLFVTPPSEMKRLVRDADAAGIATMIHGIGDAAVRAALDALEPIAGRLAMRPRIEHVQLVAASDVPRFGRSGIVASVQPFHVQTDAAGARKMWGSRAETSSYGWRALADAGAVLAFGTDAPVESFDPWPGLETAATRRAPDWPAGTPSLRPDQALSLDAILRGACLGPAVAAGEHDRGRLIAGSRADLAVIPAAAIDDPIEPGGALGRVRPRLVLIDGRVAHEA